LALEDFKAHPNGPREDNIRRHSISKGQSQNRWQPAVRKPEDKNDQPDTKNAQAKDEQPAQQAFQQSHDLATIKRSIFICFDSALYRFWAWDWPPAQSFNQSCRV
jgi:hypothetical protein